VTTLNIPLFYRLSSWDYSCDDNVLKGNFFLFFLFMYDIQHCFICRPTDSTVSEDAEIEPRTVATTALTVRRSNHSFRSHPQYIIVKIGKAGDREAFSLQKRTSSTSKHENSLLFSIFMGHFCPPGSGSISAFKTWIRIQRSYASPDPQPWFWIRIH
jgi:hypothetical protein